MKLKRILLAGAGAAAAVGLALASPRAVICETSEHTYCPESVEKSVAKLQESSFLFGTSQYPAIKQASQDSTPELADLSFRRSPLWTIIATAELSPTVFPLVIDGRDYAVRANGLLVESTGPSQPTFLFAAPTDWLEDGGDRLKNLDPDLLRRLGTLYSQLRDFNPRVTKIIFFSPEEIRLHFDGAGPALVRADDADWLPRQLTALQAFFRSSTMADTYQELDARFADLIVR